MDAQKLYLFLISLIIAAVLTPPVRRLALRIGAVDRPDSRKVHSRVMPRLGGLAIFLAFVISVLLLMRPLSAASKGLLAGATVIVAVGILDDLFSLSPLVKLAGQIGAAIVAVLFGIRIEFLTNPFDSYIPTGIISVPLTIFWIVGVTNAVNLIDGLDGLAAGVSVLASLTLSLVAASAGRSEVAALALALAGSGVGFLFYNFHPARIFMGDTGSMFLGFTLATLSVAGYLKGAAFLSLVIPVFILAIPILDTLFAIVRRFLNRQPIFKPDKEHLHHKLLSLGLSHRQAVLLIYLLTGIFGATAYFLTRTSTAQTVMVVIGVALVVVVVAAKMGMLAGERQEPEAVHWLEGKDKDKPGVDM